MARIFYGLAGEGRGHAARARAVVERLVAMGHDLVVFAPRGRLRPARSALRRRTTSSRDRRHTGAPLSVRRERPRRVRAHGGRCGALRPRAARPRSVLDRADARPRGSSGSRSERLRGRSPSRRPTRWHPTHQRRPSALPRSRRPERAPDRAPSARPLHALDRAPGVGAARRPRRLLVLRARVAPEVPRPRRRRPGRRLAASTDPRRDPCDRWTISAATSVGRAPRNC